MDIRRFYLYLQLGFSVMVIATTIILLYIFLYHPHLEVKRYIQEMDTVVQAHNQMHEELTACYTQLYGLKKQQFESQLEGVTHGPFKNHSQSHPRHPYLLY